VASGKKADIKKVAKPLAETVKKEPSKSGASIDDIIAGLVG